MKLGVMYWYIFGVTSIGSIADIRSKSVPAWFLAAASAGVIPAAFADKAVPITARVFGAAVGVLFLAVGLLSKESVGRGDALMIGISGAALGFFTLSLILCVSFFLLAIVSLGLIVIRKLGRKDRIPFFPFLAAGELVVAVLLLWT